MSADDDDDSLDITLVTPGDERLFAALLDGLSPRDQRRVLEAVQEQRQQERRVDEDETVHVRGARV